jgi:hypothetical protein
VFVEEDVAPVELERYLVQEWFIYDETLADWVGPIPLEELQFHFCNRIKLNVFLDPERLQADNAQGLVGKFVKRVVFHQWNEPWPP